ncbi:phosphonate metabolism protein/1,5-bisphosphokinase (PRPP-forming) PhnN [Xanthobacter sp. ZOL 2024]
MTTQGTLFLVVGPSGAGKDSLMDRARAHFGGDANWLFARRMVTRPAGAGGEDHIPITPEDFARMREEGAFLSSWDAHGLSYGLPLSLMADLAAGRNVVANVSRTVLSQIARRVPQTLVVHVTAPAAVLAQRLAARGRETAQDIAARLTREVKALPSELEIVTVVNDGSLEEGARRFIACLEAGRARLLRVKAVAIDSWHDNIAYLHKDCRAVPAEEFLGPGRIDVRGNGASVRARVHVTDRSDIVGPNEVGLSQHAFEELALPEGASVEVERTPTPASMDALRAKIRGEALDEARYDMVIRDVVEGRYADREVAAFLVTAAASLTDAEVEALARVRANHAHRMVWNEPMVADKHSLGGIPGSRITMIVVPIVAAYGIAIPKTSSRAITSAAGTADAMETLARVDLTVDDVRRVVEGARGCIAWNGRLNHSPADDVMNAITRPLGIDSVRWSVASILSKKLAAGATHVAIDVPVGPRAKTHTYEEAHELVRLFETVGRGLGLVVEAHATDGSGPIGRGIGPALEVRDVLQVLEGHPDAPVDLREKALFFASRILAWDPQLGLGKARARAEQLLASGAAREALDRIVGLQGRRAAPILPAPLVGEVRATAAGEVRLIDGWRVGGIARRAGAPADKGAGVDLVAPVGGTVAAGDLLYRIHAGTETDLRAALADAHADAGYRLAE